MDLVSSGMLWPAHYLPELVIHLRKQITKSRPMLVYPDPLSTVLSLSDKCHWTSWMQYWVIHLPGITGANT